MASNVIFTKTCFLVFMFTASCQLAKGHYFSDETTGDPFFSSDNRREAKRSQPFPGIKGISFYVKANATGNNEGVSWQNACNSLTTALINCKPGDTIRVAKGTYLPAGGPFILKDSVVILGGYSNTGNPTDHERNWAIHQTILSGEAGNSLFPFDNLPTIISGDSLHAAAILDGFIVEKGFANNTLTGVGLHLSNSSPSIRNCVFRNNSSYNSSLGGSSIACLYNSNPSVINCFFVNNFDFGFGTFFIKANSSPQLINCVFAMNDGRCVLYSSESEAEITNCTFVNNQIGNGVLPYDIRPGFVYANNGSALDISNTIFYNNKHLQSTDTADISLLRASLNIKNSITQNYPTGDTHLLSADPLFKDITNVAGPDNFYFTSDDGLQTEPCSPAINEGNNQPVTAVLMDVLLQPRIYDGMADIGAYEFQSGNGNEILLKSKKSIIANREYTDKNGWTHYYNDCLLLLSVKKNGRPIGTINDGTFLVSVRTTPDYGSENGTDLSRASYVHKDLAWFALNRLWSIRATAQPADSILIRVPFSGTDIRDAGGINPEIISPMQLVFCNIGIPYSLLDSTAPATHFNPYFIGNAPTTKTWKYSSVDSVHYAEYYVKNLSNGGIGTGTGIKNGPFAEINNGCQGGNRIITSPTRGSAYQWQVNDGNGFGDINDVIEYSGENTLSLTIHSPSTSWYGKSFRCLVTGKYGSEITSVVLLKFESRWTGAVSSDWNNAANWSCGVVPDENTDVIINSGTPNNLLVNTDIICRSIHLSANAVATVLSGKKLTITGK